MSVMQLLKLTAWYWTDDLGAGPRAYCTEEQVVAWPHGAGTRWPLAAQEVWPTRVQGECCYFTREELLKEPRDCGRLGLSRLSPSTGHLTSWSFSFQIGDFVPPLWGSRFRCEVSTVSNTSSVLDRRYLLISQNCLRQVCVYWHHFADVKVYNNNLIHKSSSFTP